MYYEINVGKDGYHYFATAERSLTSEKKAIEVYNQFLKVFPESEGYKVTLTAWQNTGKVILG